MLELQNVSKTVGGEAHIRDVSLTLKPGTLNVLLGPTLSGKTSLMRLMAGLDRPTSGKIFANGKDTAGVRVQKRNLAMVYQQFINYPTLTVYENIASPLRVSGADRSTIDREVRRVAELLRLTAMLSRHPLELSGGQQQRTAIARAIVKKAGLVLLDEPLANLDYKLREELRAELPRIFSTSGAIYVYATTEPTEALLLGGNTATLAEGRVTQFGPTLEIFRHPHDLLTARTFADPPLNTAEAIKHGGTFKLASGERISVPPAFGRIVDGRYILGFRAHHLSFRSEPPRTVALPSKVLVTEVTGSESFIHLQHGESRWVMLTRGVHILDSGMHVEAHLDTRHVMVFDTTGAAIPQDPSLAA